MTEEAWQACREPGPMLSERAHLMSERQLRLFAAACCRRVEMHLVDPGPRNALAMVESFADGQADQRELDIELSTMSYLCYTEYTYAHETLPVILAAQAVRFACMADGVVWVVEAASNARAAHAHAIGFDSAEKREAEEAREAARQSDILRDIVGSSFARVGFDPLWRTWNDGLVSSLGEGIYRERAFDRLPILGDALEDAGCDNEEMLSHCREQEAAHVRGCWLVDLLLAKPYERCSS